jgi:hypothetical protein
MDVRIRRVVKLLKDKCARRNGSHFPALLNGTTHAERWVCNNKQALGIGRTAKIPKEVKTLEARRRNFVGHHCHKSPSSQRLVTE